MTHVYRLFAALFAAALMLTACGGPQSAENASEPTDEPAVAATGREATEGTGEANETTEDMDEPVIAASAEDFPVTVTDGLGRELTFDTPPERVVALYNGNFGNLATLAIRPVGALVNNDMLVDPRYFEDGESIPSVGDPNGSINLEAIVATEPDLIIALSLEEVQALEGITTVYIPLNVDTLEGLYAETRNLAAILGIEERAEANISAFQDRLSAYQVLAPRDVSILVTAAGLDNLNAISIRHGGSPDCRLLNEIAICDWDDPINAEGWSFETTPETLLELNPDFIYFRTWTGTRAELSEAVQQNPLWTELDAIQNDRLLYVEGYPNPIASNLIDATKILDTFAPLLYPDIFPESLTDEEVQEILAER